jgi:hypothetical protein
VDAYFVSFRFVLFHLPFKPFADALTPRHAIGTPTLDKSLKSLLALKVRRHSGIVALNFQIRIH